MQATRKKVAPRGILELTAANVMTAPVLTIPQETSLQEAARLLCRSSISGAPVVDEQGRCVGVISSSDFVTWAGKGAETVETVEAIGFIAPWGELIHIQDSPNTEIRNFMTARPISVAPGTPIGDLARKMAENHIHRVLVVEGSRPKGIVSSTDIMAALARAAG
jgi:CBS domain-containing protein